MFEDFLSYINDHLSLNKKNKILISCSGGMDSMLMLYLFLKSEYFVGVAHIDHSTRAGLSIEDANFVASFCKKNSIPFFLKTLDPSFKKESNFQERARKARRQFLEEVAQKHGYDFIATAHHQDDRWETFMMNLNRKSGTKGLTALRAIDGQFIRPLLFTKRAEIETYVASTGIAYRHDTSNDGDNYQRNRIRHHITPNIIQEFPSFIPHVNQSIAHLEESVSLIESFIEDKKYVIEKGGLIYVDLKNLKKTTPPHTLLYHCIGKFGFNITQCKEMIATKTNGAYFSSDQYEAIYDRDDLVIQKIDNEDTTIQLTITEPGEYQAGSRIICIENKDKVDPHLLLDTKKVRFPLTLRTIVPSDKFEPAGMGGKSKSIKDFLIDNKINRFAKRKIILVEMEKKIIQVVGMRSAEGYIAQNHDDVISISFKNN